MITATADHQPLGKIGREAKIPWECSSCDDFQVGIGNLEELKKSAPDESNTLKDLEKITENI